MELPQVDAVSFSNRHDLVIVPRVELDVRDGERVSNECLVLGGNVLLCIVVPNLDQGVLASRQHVAPVETQV